MGCGGSIPVQTKSVNISSLIPPPKKQSYPLLNNQPLYLGDSIAFMEDGSQILGIVLDQGWNPQQQIRIKTNHHIQYQYPILKNLHVTTLTGGPTFDSYLKPWRLHTDSKQIFYRGEIVSTSSKWHHMRGSVRRETDPTTGLTEVQMQGQFWFLDLAAEGFQLFTPASVNGGVEDSWTPISPGQTLRPNEHYNTDFTVRDRFQTAFHVIVPTKDNKTGLVPLLPRTELRFIPGQRIRPDMFLQPNDLVITHRGRGKVIKTTSISDTTLVRILPRTLPYMYQPNIKLVDGPSLQPLPIQQVHRLQTGDLVSSKQYGKSYIMNGTNQSDVDGTIGLLYIRQGMPEEKRIHKSMLQQLLGGPSLWRELQPNQTPNVNDCIMNPTEGRGRVVIKDGILSVSYEEQEFEMERREMKLIGGPSFNLPGIRITDERIVTDVPNHAANPQLPNSSANYYVDLEHSQHRTTQVLSTNTDVQMSSIGTEAEGGFIDEMSAPMVDSWDGFGALPPVSLFALKVRDQISIQQAVEAFHNPTHVTDTRALDRSKLGRVFRRATLMSPVNPNQSTTPVEFQPYDQVIGMGQPELSLVKRSPAFQHHAQNSKQAYDPSSQPLANRDVTEIRRNQESLQYAIGQRPIELSGISLGWLKRFISKVLNSGTTTAEVVRDHPLFIDGCKRKNCRMTDFVPQHNVGHPHFFISHNWRNPFKQLVETVINWIHSNQKSYPILNGKDDDHIFVWIDIFSVNQGPHNEMDLSLNPLQRTIQAALCGTLVVADNKGATFTRMWCLFEMWETMQKRKELLERNMLSEQESEHLLYIIMPSRLDFESHVWNKLGSKNAQCVLPNDKARFRDKIQLVYESHHPSISGEVSTSEGDSAWNYFDDHLVDFILQTSARFDPPTAAKLSYLKPSMVKSKVQQIEQELNDGIQDEMVSSQLHLFVGSYYLNQSIQESANLKTPRNEQDLNHSIEVSSPSALKAKKHFLAARNVNWEACKARSEQLKGKVKNAKGEDIVTQFTEYMTDLMNQSIGQCSLLNNTAAALHQLGDSPLVDLAFSFKLLSGKLEQLGIYFLASSDRLGLPIKNLFTCQPLEPITGVDSQIDAALLANDAHALIEHISRDRDLRRKILTDLKKRGAKTLPPYISDLLFYNIVCSLYIIMGEYHQAACQIENGLELILLNVQQPQDLDRGEMALTWMNAASLLSILQLEWSPFSSVPAPALRVRRKKIRPPPPNSVDSNKSSGLPGHSKLSASITDWAGYGWVLKAVHDQRLESYWESVVIRMTPDPGTFNSGIIEGSGQIPCKLNEYMAQQALFSQRMGGRVGTPEDFAAFQESIKSQLVEPIPFVAVNFHLKGFWNTSMDTHQSSISMYREGCTMPLTYKISRFEYKSMQQLWNSNETAIYDYGSDPTILTLILLNEMDGEKVTLQIQNDAFTELNDVNMMFNQSSNLWNQLFLEQAVSWQGLTMIHTMSSIRHLEELVQMKNRAKMFTVQSQKELDLEKRATQFKPPVSGLPKKMIHSIAAGSKEKVVDARGKSPSWLASIPTNSLDTFFELFHVQHRWQPQPSAQMGNLPPTYCRVNLLSSFAIDVDLAPMKIDDLTEAVNRIVHNAPKLIQQWTPPEVSTWINRLKSIAMEEIVTRTNGLGLNEKLQTANDHWAFHTSMGFIYLQMDKFKEGFHEFETAKSYVKGQPFLINLSQIHQYLLSQLVARMNEQVRLIHIAIIQDIKKQYALLEEMPRLLGESTYEGRKQIIVTAIGGLKRLEGGLALGRGRHCPEIYSVIDRMKVYALVNDFVERWEIFHRDLDWLAKIDFSHIWKDKSVVTATVAINSTGGPSITTAMINGEDSSSFDSKEYGWYCEPLGFTRPDVAPSPGLLLFLRTFTTLRTISLSQVRNARDINGVRLHHGRDRRSREERNRHTEYLFKSNQFDTPDCYSDPQLLGSMFGNPELSHI